MSEMKKRNIIIGSLSVIVLLMIVGYAAFSTSLNIKGTSNITSNWNVKISNVTTKNTVGTASNNENPTFTDTAVTFKTDLKSPGDSLEYEVTITNSGTLNAKVDKITLSDTNNPAIKFTSSGITEGDVIEAGGKGILLVKVEFLSTVSSTPSNKTSNLTVTLDYVQGDNIVGEVPYAADHLRYLAVVTEGDGLYESSFETEDYNARYIYKGTNPNNYIKFNNELWRIVSVETDDTLKIVKDEKLPEDMPYDERTSETTGPRLNSENTFCKLEESGVYYGCNVWEAVNGTLTVGELSGTVTKNASLNTYLNDVYLKTINSDYRKMITPHNFKLGATLNNTTVDTIINNEKTREWNGMIALLSIGDFVQSSNNIECSAESNPNKLNNPCLFNNYLYVNYDWWLLNNSPSSSGSSPRVHYDTVQGFMGGYYSYFSFGVRPALYLKHDIYISGEGTKVNPYIIQS